MKATYFDLLSLVIDTEFYDGNDTVLINSLFRLLRARLFYKSNNGVTTSALRIPSSAGATHLVHPTRLPSQSFQN